MYGEPVKRPVLVIDDDPEWLSFTCSVLVGDYPVLCSSSAESGLDLAAKVEPAVVILDVMMPDGRDGFSTFCELRKRDETRDVPVIMFSQVNEATGLDFSGDSMGQYLGTAPSAFLEKPVPPETLMKAVRHAIHTRKK